MIRYEKGNDDIMDDAARAYKKGLSYGEYKAGVKKAVAEKGYSVSSGEFMRRSEPSSESKVKTKAFIKV